MGDTNVVSLLGRISMNLDRLVQMNTAQQAPREQQKVMTGMLNSGAAAMSQVPKEQNKDLKNQANIDINMTGVSPKELSGILSSFPKQVLTVALLKKSVMDDFKKVFTSFVKTLSLFNEIEIDPKSAAAAKTITESLTTISTVNFNKLSKQMKTVGGEKFGKAFNTTMKYIVSGLKQFEKLDNGKIKPGTEAALASAKLIDTLISSVNKIMIGVIGMSLAIKFIGGEEIAKSTLIVLGTLTALTGIAMGVAVLSKFVGEDSVKNLSTISGFIFKMQLLCISTLLLGFMYKTASPVITEGFIGMATTLLGYTAVMTLCGIVAGFAKTGMKNMSTVALIAGAAIGLTVATMFLGEFTKAAHDEILKGFLATSGIILGYTGVITAAAWIAKRQPAVMKDFAAVALIAAGAMAVTYTTLLLGKAIRGEATEKSEFAGEWMIAEGFAITSGIILGYTGVILAASKISPVNAGKALIGLGSIGLLALGTIYIVKKTADAAKIANETGAKNVFVTLGIAAAMITGFGVLAGAAGALVFGPQAAIFAAGLAALASIDLLILGTSATMAKAVTAANTVNNARRDDGTYEFDSLTGSFNAMVDGLAGMINLGFVARVAKISAASIGLITVGKIIAEVATCMSKVALISGPNGTVRGVTITDDGRFVYGDFVDIKASSTAISEAFGTFTSIMLGTFKAISLGQLVKGGVGVKIISGMMKPVSLFAKTMLSFMDAGQGKIKEIRFNQDGTLMKTPEVDVKKVSEIIAASISTFASTLFSEKNQETWKRITEGKMNHDGTSVIYAEKAMGILATVISPVCEFAGTLTQFNSGDSNKIIVPVYDQNGKVTSQREINVVNVANSIAGAVSTFASTLFSEKNTALWEQLYKPKTNQTKKGGIFTRAEYETVNEMESAAGVFANILTPVVSFTNLLSKYGSGGENTLVVYDANGGSREIDVTDVASKISGSVTAFVKTLTENLNLSNDSTAEALANTTNSISAMFTSFDKFIGNPEDNSMAKLNISVDNVSKSFKDFDKVLAEGTAKRIDSINKLGEAFETLKEKLADAKNDINEVREIFEALNGTNLSNIDNVVNKISEKLKFTIDTRGGVTTTDITSAIISAIDGGSLQEYTFGSGDSARHRYEIDLDDSFSH